MGDVEPADGAMLPYLVRHMAQTYGCFYLRFGRKKLMRVYGDGEDFTLGRAIKLRDGRDAARRPLNLSDRMAQDGRELTRIFVSARTGEGLPLLRAELALRARDAAQVAVPLGGDDGQALPIGHNGGLHSREVNE